MSVFSMVADVWRRRAEKRSRKKALAAHGWDGKCSGCGRWMHAEQCASMVRDEPMHWVYQCDCGSESWWWLGAPVPIFDDGRYGRSSA